MPKTQKTIHIAILDADIPVPTVYEKRGLYSTQFRDLLRSAAYRLNTPSYRETDTDTGLDVEIDIQTSSFDVVGGVLPCYEWLRTSSSDTCTSDKGQGPGAIDAILITGSASSANEAPTKPWIQNLQEFIQRVYLHFPAVRVFGSCFGHQVVARGLLDPSQEYHQQGQAGAGAKVEKCPAGYEIGIHSIQLSPEFKAHFPRVLSRHRQHPGQSQSQSEGQGDDVLKLQLIHGDRVIPTSTSTSPNSSGRLPSPWINIGSTPLSPIQGLFNPNRVLTYQGHFEFDSFVNRELCREFGRRGGWTQEVIDGFVRQIESSDEDDSKLAAEVVVLFFAGMS